MTQIRLLIVDDHAMFRESLRAILECEDDLMVLGEAGDIDEAVQLASRAQPDIVLLDLNLPSCSGVQAVSAMRAVQPGPDVIVVTMFEDDDLIVEALRAGAQGYVLKGAPAAELVDAIRAVAGGGAGFTSTIASRVLVHWRRLVHGRAPPCRSEMSESEIEVLRLLADSASNAAIVKKLCLSPNTVKNVLTGIYGKLGASNRTEALLEATKRGLLRPNR
jgi:DNA-binding NarL/FixJ family response regulator